MENKEKVAKRWRIVHERIENHIKSANLQSGYRLHLARIIGYLAGDGYVSARKEQSNNNIHYEVAFYPDDKEMLKSFIESFEFIYGLLPQIKDCNSYYRVRIASKPICKHILDHGNLKTKKWTIPFTEKSEIREWLKAFFDCEAHVSKKQIQVQSVNKLGIEQIRSELKKLGVSSQIYTYTRKQRAWSTNYILAITNRESRTTFLKEIGFFHSRKKAAVA